MTDDLLFITGLSIDKKSLNTAYSNIVNDGMYQEFLDDIKDLCLSIPKPSSLKKYSSDITKDSLISESYDTLKETVTSDPILNVLSPLLALDPTSAIFGKLASSILGTGINYIADKTNRKTYKGSPFSEVFIKSLVTKPEIQKKINELQNLDFFKVYLSNQSDSRGVPAIAKMITTIPNLKTHWGYCDRPFYQNEFIDSLKITVVNEDLLKNNSMELLHAQYMLHGVDIVLSRMIEEIDSSKLESKNRTYNDVVSSISSQFMTEFGKSISERCFFGIDLLSRVFLTLHHQKYEVDGALNDSERSAPTLRIGIKEDASNPNITEFLKELIECSGDPLHTKIVTSEYDILISLNDTKVSNGEKKSKRHLSKGAKIKANYLTSNSLVVPIKLFISLPLLMKNGSPDKPSHAALMPELLTTSSDDIVDILTSGGIEHNRPLMHLINAHRLKQQEKRVFGFIDNHFDFYHRWVNDKEKDFDHLFIMGVAQPVSGFNQVLLKRFDSSEGFSSSKEAKQIIFSVKCPVSNKTFVVLSSYGFSALASVYATLRIISKLLDTNSKNQSSSLLEGAASVMEGAKMDIDSGYSWRVVFSDQTEEAMYKASNGVDPFSVITSANFPAESEKLVKLFLTNEKDGGVISNIHPARALTNSK